MNLYSQESFFSYEKIKVDEISSIEKKFNSKIFFSTMDHIIEEKDGLVNYGKPKVYRRDINKHLDKVDVKYFYLKSDSIIRQITYSWVNSKNAELKDYSKMFDKTVEKISADLDLPIGGQGKLLKIMDDSVNEIPVELTERRVNWKYGEANITIIMVWTEEHGASLRTSIDWE